MDRVNVFQLRARRVPVYGETMALSEVQYRLGVVTAGAALAATLLTVRFCGSVTLPPVPSLPPATASAAPAMASSSGSPAMYRDFLVRDAAEAGVPTPSIADMSRRFTVREDRERHVFEVGQPAIELAGLRLSAQRLDAARAGGTIVLDIVNTATTDLAYLVVSEPSPNASNCNEPRALPIDAMVIARGQRVRRTECYWTDGIAIVVTRVETMALPPLAAWYVRQLPPSVVGIDERIARAHRSPAATPVEDREKCSPIVAQVVRSGLDRGEIDWRDLIDFYARHRCYSYQFPSIYRAFTRDGERPVPIGAAGM